MHYLKLVKISLALAHKQAASKHAINSFALLQIRRGTYTQSVASRIRGGYVKRDTYRVTGLFQVHTMCALAMSFVAFPYVDFFLPHAALYNASSAHSGSALYLG